MTMLAWGELWPPVARGADGWVVAVLINGACWIVVGVVFGLVVLARKRRESKRAEAMAMAAESMKLPFQPGGDAGWLGRWSGFPLMNTGRKHQVTNVLEIETSQARGGLFDFHYIIGSGKHQKRYWQTVLAIETASLQAPVFSLWPEKTWDRIRGVFGAQDIDFQDHAVFSDAFVLKGDSEQEVRAYLDTELLDFFALRPGVCVEVSGGRYLYFRRSQRIDPDPVELQEFMEEGMQVFVELVAREQRATPENRL